MDTPASAYPHPGFSPPAAGSMPAPDRRSVGARRAQQLLRERGQAACAAQTRDSSDNPPADLTVLPVRWHNAISEYEIHQSGDAVDIVLVSTCAAEDCRAKTYPNRPVFRGRFDGSRLIGVVPMRGAAEHFQGSAVCAMPAGEFPARGKLSSDGRWICWEKTELPREQGCGAAVLSLGIWGSDP